MASVTETALDLSSKSAPTTPVLSPARPVSPALSLSSDDQGRSSSASSVGSASPSPPPAKHPSPPPSQLTPLPPLSLPVKEESAVAPVSGRGAPSSMRPFKMYPFEPLSSSIYSQIAASQSASAAAAGLYPLGALPGASPAPAPAVSASMPQLPMFDSAVSLSSPITQYLQQRKRRHDGRCSSGSTSSVESMGPVCGQDPLSMLSAESDHDGSKKVKLELEERKDEAYWERRRKNNEAAKRSRDARRAKEEEIALRAAFLEQENLKLRAQVAILKNETTKLHYMLYNRL